ncbi:MAG: hypothetical protein NW223_05635 [Hyphomicrobiaceae bacterium]|nr:hypothetical protein [Hyphomicrobiaceae bacterium]
MAIGQGDAFSRMLDEVGLRRDEAPAPVRLRLVGNPGYHVQFVSAPGRPLTAETLGGLYLEELVYDAVTMAGASPPSNTTDPADIAAELAITGATSIDDLNRLRRTFALANHPDRLPPAYRDIATRRMMVANRLIDEAIFRRP